MINPPSHRRDESDEINGGNELSRVKAREIAQWRMHNLGLWGDPVKGAADVVARLGAMQAQEFPYAKWSVAQRTSAAGDADVDRLFDKGTILRTHLLRPTWHFVLPEDIRWILGLTAPRVKTMVASYDRQLELDERLYARTNRLIAKALEGGKQLTRKELVATLNRSKITGTNQRFGHIMMRAELDAVVCSGALRGKQHTYALLDDRAPKYKVLESDEALAELTRRYFTTRGPATLKDYSWWSSLKMGDCRRAADMLGGKLESKDVDGRTYWFASGSEPPKRSNWTVDLVQVYDECVVAYTLSRDVLSAQVKGDFPKDIMFYWHPILFGGQVLGHWRRRTQGKLLWLEVFLYRKLTRAENRSLDAAVQRYEDFLGEPVEVRWHK
jgi:hypothetical protein